MIKYLVTFFLLVSAALGQVQSIDEDILFHAAGIKTPAAGPVGDKSLTLIVTNSVIDGDLTGTIPICVYLSSSSGLGNTDVTDVFTELGASSNKIAVTQDGTSLPIEVEYYNETEEQAVLWVGAASLSNAAVTELTLTYNSTDSANSDLGGLHSDTATNVWAADWRSVYHFAGNTATNLDSAAARLHAPAVSGEASLTNGIVGCPHTSYQIADPTANNSYETTSTDTYLAELTVMCWVYWVTDPNGSARHIDRWGGSSGNSEYLLTTRQDGSTDLYRFAIYNGNFDIFDSGGLGNTLWHSGILAYKNDGAASEGRAWVNDSQLGTTHTGGDIPDRNLSIDFNSQTGTGTHTFRLDEAWEALNELSDAYIQMLDDNCRDEMIYYTVN